MLMILNKDNYIQFSETFEKLNKTKSKKRDKIETKQTWIDKMRKQMRRNIKRKRKYLPAQSYFISLTDKTTKQVSHIQDEHLNIKSS